MLTYSLTINRMSALRGRGRSVAPGSGINRRTSQTPPPRARVKPVSLVARLGQKREDDTVKELLDDIPDERPDEQGQEDFNTAKMNTLLLVLAHVEKAGYIPIDEKNILKQCESDQSSLKLDQFKMLFDYTNNDSIYLMLFSDIYDTIIRIRDLLESKTFSVDSVDRDKLDDDCRTIWDSISKKYSTYSADLTRRLESVVPLSKEYFVNIFLSNVCEIHIPEVKIREHQSTSLNDRIMAAYYNTDVHRFATEANTEGDIAGYCNEDVQDKLLYMIIGQEPPSKRDRPSIRQRRAQRRARSRSPAPRGPRSETVSTLNSITNNIWGSIKDEALALEKNYTADDIKSIKNGNALQFSWQVSLENDRLYRPALTDEFNSDFTTDELDNISAIFNDFLFRKSQIPPAHRKFALDVTKQQLLRAFETSADIKKKRRVLDTVLEEQNKNNKKYFYAQVLRWKANTIFTKWQEVNLSLNVDNLNDVIMEELKAKVKLLNAVHDLRVQNGTFKLDMDETVNTKLMNDVTEYRTAIREMKEQFDLDLKASIKNDPPPTSYSAYLKYGATVALPVAVAWWYTQKDSPPEAESAKLQQKADDFHQRAKKAKQTAEEALAEQYQLMKQENEALESASEARLREKEQKQNEEKAKHNKEVQDTQNKLAAARAKLASLEKKMTDLEHGDNRTKSKAQRTQIPTNNTIYTSGTYSARHHDYA